MRAETQSDNLLKRGSTHFKKTWVEGLFTFHKKDELQILSAAIDSSRPAVQGSVAAFLSTQVLRVKRQSPGEIKTEPTRQTEITTWVSHRFLEGTFCQWDSRKHEEWWRSNTLQANMVAWPNEWTPPLSGPYLGACACFLLQRMLWPGVQSSLEPAEPQIPTSVSSLPVLNASSCLCKACILIFIPKQSLAILPENSVCHSTQQQFRERVCCAVDFLPGVMNLSSRKDGRGRGCVKTFLYGKV